MGWYESHVFNAILDRQLDSPAMHAERAAARSAAW